jgi:tetrahydromethanopterin S-methyltransferase subunit B
VKKLETPKVSQKPSENIQSLQPAKKTFKRYTNNDVYFCSGNFINTDYGYQAYAQIDEFLKLTPNVTGGTWTDLTSTYLSGLTSYVY